MLFCGRRWLDVTDGEKKSYLREGETSVGLYRSQEGREGR